MTVKELIEKLKEMPEDWEVQDYTCETITWLDMEILEHCKVVILR